MIAMLEEWLIFILRVLLAVCFFGGKDFRGKVLAIAWQYCYPVNNQNIVEAKKILKEANVVVSREGAYFAPR